MTVAVCLESPCHAPVRGHATRTAGGHRELLVTSKNFLSASDLTEAGLLLTAPPGRRGEPPLTCPVILEVLKFLYDHIPDPATAFKLIHTREGFGPRRDKPGLPPVPLPRLTAAVLDQNAPPEHARAWAAAWQEAARALADRAVRSRPTVEVIKDGQHAALVREALEEARHRVLITSHKVSRQALTDEVCALAADRAAQGLDAAVRYGELMDDESAARLKRLAASPGLERAGVRLEKTMHAKVVIRDGSTVLGSFNHLSVDTGVRGRRATGELSVRIASAAVAGEVWAALLGRPARPPSEPPAAAEAAREPGVPVQLLLELLEPPGGLPDVDALAALMPAVWTAGAWACAHQVRRHIADPGRSPRAVLTGALADRASTPGSPGRRRRRRSSSPRPRPRSWPCPPAWACCWASSPTSTRWTCCATGSGRPRRAAPGARR